MKKGGRQWNSKRSELSKSKARKECTSCKKAFSCYAMIPLRTTKKEGYVLYQRTDQVTDKGEQPDTIRLIPLPSADDPDLEDPPISVKGHKLPMSIADLTMDPSQDLIVISEYK